MAQGGIDARGRRTRVRLRRELFARAHEEGGAEVTVSALCREAQIHRTTFYKHYSSVEEFLFDSFAQILDDIVVPVEVESGVHPGTAWRGSAVRSWTVMYNRREVLRSIVSASGSIRLRVAAIDRLTPHFAEVVPFTTPEGTRLDSQIAGTIMAAGAVAAGISFVFSDRDDPEGAVDEWIACLPPWFPRSPA